MYFPLSFAETRKVFLRSLDFACDPFGLSCPLEHYTILISACDDHCNQFIMIQIPSRVSLRREQLGGPNLGLTKQNLKQDLLSSAESHAPPPLSPACYPK